MKRFFTIFALVWALAACEKAPTIITDDSPEYTGTMIVAYEGEEFEGKVSLVYPTIDAATHTFPVEVTIANPEGKVRPGMFARATVNFGDVQRVVVPDVAVVKQIVSGDRFVYVYNEGMVSYNKVQLGRHMGEYYEIISGVESGAQVVVAGQTRLVDGREVTVVQ